MISIAVLSFLDFERFILVYIPICSCASSNMYFGNLLLVASTAVLAVAAPSVKTKRAKNFQFFGVNESGAEFGNANLPGTLNKDYIWPPTYASVLACQFNKD